MWNWSIFILIFLTDDKFKCVSQVIVHFDKWFDELIDVGIFCVFLKDENICLKFENLKKKRFFACMNFEKRKALLMSA